MPEVNDQWNEEVERFKILREELCEALDDVEESIQPIWERLLRTLGKNPGRTVLRREAAESGIAISERQARDVIKRLGCE